MFTALRDPEGNMTFIDRPIINPEVKRDFDDVISNDMAGNLKEFQRQQQHVRRFSPLSEIM